MHYVSSWQSILDEAVRKAEHSEGALRWFVEVEFASVEAEKMVVMTTANKEPLVMHADEGDWTGVSDVSAANACLSELLYLDSNWLSTDNASLVQAVVLLTVEWSFCFTNA